MDHYQTYLRRLKELFEETTPENMKDGLEWYPKRFDQVTKWANTYELPIRTVAGVIAAVSPRVDWEKNLVIAESILNGSPLAIGAFPSNVQKAIRIRDWKIVDTREVFKDALKVFNFSKNLAGDYRYVTIDTHMVQAIKGDPTFIKGIRKKEYNFYQNVLRDAAYQEAIQPALYQSVIWHTWKRKYSRMDKRRMKNA